ncbi:ribonuclease R [Methylonatrum kenyense]|uniref:ribonuclease R n=1 Tax=Methylonatrum kenyense TaxID=455253 RepID=UPI0020BF7DAE|nr:ribonuclease R [Methylonatrum kenyense]MCK8516128.1 ribonuclease R [Methylonatrum kenyense]
MAKTGKRPAAKDDPYLAREAKKYDRPVPSREFILQRLEELAQPLSREDLAAHFELTDEEGLEGLRRRLIAMERDGQLVRNRRGGYIPVDHEELIRGRIIGHGEGYGWLVPDVGGERIFLSPRDMRRVLNGDRAVVQLVGLDQKGQPEGKLVEVLSRANRTLVGRYFMESGVGFVVPQNRRLHLDVIVPEQDAGGARSNELVLVELQQQPSQRSQPVGRVMQVLGEHIRPGDEIMTAALTHDIPTEWPEVVLHEVAGIPDTVQASALGDRVDLREVPLVTIDGADARDFDDALYCEPTATGWRLLVAIADVSHYVRPGSALDQEARNRGNSVYFPGQVVPMLPEKLSNGLCSLNPDVDRLCMVCEMLISKSGEIRRSRFFRGVMRSHARTLYDVVARVVADRDEEMRSRYKALLPQLDNLYQLFLALRKARERRGAIDFDSTETQILFDPEGGIEDIVPTERNDAHKLVEECMLAANMATARFLRRHRIPTLFRIHEGPDGDRLDNLRLFLSGVGLSLGGGDTPQAADYARLMEQIKSRPDRALIQTIMLRSLQQAVYHPDNAGHFGLAMQEYAHFTSPIRRYPDLLVHRAIGHVLDGGKASDFPILKDEMLSLGEHCSMTERRADEATRDAVMIMKCHYMRNQVGEAFDGVVTGVTGFGIFVELDDVYVDGLVHVTSLDNDFFHFDPVNHRLSGERSGITYSLTDRVRVQLAKVDPDERKIDLELIGRYDRAGSLQQVQQGHDGDGRKPRRGPRKGAGRKPGRRR